MKSVVMSRRRVMAGAGALAMSFAGGAGLRAQQAEQRVDLAAQPPRAPLPGSLAKTPLLDSWIRIDADGSITVFTGKAELGQGIKTALMQVAAEELDVPVGSLTLVTADTARTPDEAYTAGSHSLQDSGTAILHAAAQVRGLLIAEAARRLDLPEAQLRTEAGAVVARDGRRIGYGGLVSNEMLHAQAQPQSPLKQPAAFKLIGKPVRRVDLPAKVTGAPAYVQDLRLPDMVHARVVRPPSYGARLVAVDAREVEAMEGVVKVVRGGSFLAVAAEREFQAIKAMRALAAAARWDETARLPDQHALGAALTGLPAEEMVILDQRAATTHGATTLEATYTRPYLLHGSIGPSCAVARFDDRQLTVWTHTQGVYPDRRAIAEMLGMATERVRCIQVEGSGCYGHNGADDAAADAALVARAIPGRPVRVQWMRDQEHGWEPYGPAMVTKVRGALDGNGRIVDWDYDVWSNTHSTRPGGAGALLAARYLAQPFAAPPPVPIPMPEGGGDRNAIPLYRLPSARVAYHFIPAMPLRVSALRALGGYMNVFSIESFMDELAAAASADPVAFRLAHLEDPRARDVVTMAADRFGWSTWARPTPGAGRGFAFARYKNLAAYCAVAVEVDVAPDSGEARLARAVAAVDSGQTVNPDGLRNQIEGAILQSTSWTLHEQVTFDRNRITSLDWSTYPILRFDAVPQSVEVHIIDRPGLPFLGSGEAAHGPTAAALANAIANATGHRFRELPLTRDRIKAALRT